MPTSHLIDEVVPLLREAAAIMADPTVDSRTESFARSAFRFAARVFDSYVTTERPAVAHVTHAPPTTLPTAKGRDVSERRTRSRRKTGTCIPRVKPEAYVTRELIDQTFDWWTAPGRTDTLRSAYGRRADCFLAATVLIEGGNEATAEDVALLTGVKPNNASTMLNDLCVYDVLRRHVKDGHVHFTHSNWTKERLK